MSPFLVLQGYTKELYRYTGIIVDSLLACCLAHQVYSLLFDTLWPPHYRMIYSDLLSQQHCFITVTLRNQCPLLFKLPAGGYTYAEQR